MERGVIGSKGALRYNQGLSIPSPACPLQIAFSAPPSNSRVSIRPDRGGRTAGVPLRCNKDSGTGPGRAGRANRRNRGAIIVRVGSPESKTAQTGVRSSPPVSQYCYSPAPSVISYRPRRSQRVGEITAHTDSGGLRVKRTSRCTTIHR
jgi:hypothetical protein